MDVPYLFAGIGAIILMGFMGSLLFERTKIPDILILIFIGLIIGPILTTYTSIGILDDPEISGALTQIAPIFSSFTPSQTLLRLRLSKAYLTMNLVHSVPIPWPQKDLSPALF